MRMAVYRAGRSPSFETELQMEERMSIQTRWLTVLLTLTLLPSLAWPQESPAAPAAPQVEELTLEQAVALALRENRQVKIVSLEFDKFLVEASAATRQRLGQVVADAERFRSILA